MSVPDVLNLAMDDVVEFLRDSTPVMFKGAVVENLLGLTGTQEGIHKMSKSKDLIKGLKNVILSKNEHERILTDSLKIFVNLTSVSVARVSNAFSLLVQPDFISFLLEDMLNQDSKTSDISAMILTNLSQCEKDCCAILSCVRSADSNIKIFHRLAKAFCVEKFNRHGSFDHCGMFLANMTVIQDVRCLLLDPQGAVFQQILPYIQYSLSVAKRVSAVRVVRNCSFETEYHKWLLSDDVDILPVLLLPLAGPEEFDEEEMEKLPLDLQYLPSDKKREPVKQIIIMLIETLLQLCCTQPCRLRLKASGAYYILRELFNSTDDREVLVPLERLIQILIGDEPEPGMENLKEIEIPPELQKKFEEIDRSGL